MVKYFSVLVFLMILSCIPYHKNEYGIYEPNSPNYSLKDKKDFTLPKNLDTVNFYQYNGFYENGIIKTDDNAKKVKWCLKFFDNGRLLNVSKKEVNYEFLNPKFANKEYYFYDKKKELIKIESFVTTEGGQYNIINYQISKNGDTLTSVTNSRMEYVFIRERIPNEWKRYKPDW